MLNYIWGFMILGGIIYGGIKGADAISLVSDGVIDSAGEAIELCITMLGVVGLWSGLMNIAKEAGLIAKWTKGLDPALSFLFPQIPLNHPVRQDIATNIIANILGLGWAATPAGIKAMKGLKSLSKEGNKASNAMCTFLVINISSLQLIPVNIIAYRREYGAAEPVEIIGPALLATFSTTIVAVVLCKVICGFSKD
ncbi:MAG: nucleoside recognition protein [Lachnospiraceae bacterium]|nr:nucleoside recognition protein [Lachnospiraceae bacterium]